MHSSTYNGRTGGGLLPSGGVGHLNTRQTLGKGLSCLRESIGATQSLVYAIESAPPPPEVKPLGPQRFTSPGLLTGWWRSPLKQGRGLVQPPWVVTSQ